MTQRSIAWIAAAAALVFATNASSQDLGAVTGGMDLSSMSSGSAGNAAGILQFCISNNYLTANAAGSMKDRLVSKIGGADAAHQDTGYADGAKKASKAPKMDFGLGDTPPLPKADGMSNVKPEDDGATQTRKPADPKAAKYELVSVENAQQFDLRNDKYQARYVIPKIDVANLPMTVPAFHTLVQVHSDDRLGAAIEVRLLDPKGGQVVASQGALVFGGHDEAEFLVDWDPFTLKTSGTYNFEVTVAGQVLGKRPFPVTQELRASLVATQPTDAGAPADPSPAPAQQSWP